MNGITNFDWVKARASCSLFEVFKQLRLDAEADADRVNTVRGLSVGLRFSVISNNAGNAFSVSREGNVSQEVKFVVGKDSIGISPSWDNYIKVTLTLNNEGRCKLKVDGGEELEQWQVRRMALEELFFGAGQ